MIDRLKRSVHRFDRRQGGSGSAGDHDHLDAEQTGGLDLGVGRRTTTVLGDDGVDSIRLKQLDFALERKRAAVEHVFDIRHGQRRIDGIDAAHQIEMLRGNLGMMSALTTGRQKDATRGGPKSGDRRRNIRNDMPMIARYWHPFGSDEANRGDTGALRRNDSIGRNPFGEGVGGINQQVIALSRQEARKTLRTTETANADRNWLSGRGLRAAGQRQENVEVFPRGKRVGQPTRLTGAPEDQDTGLLHV